MMTLEKQLVMCELSGNVTKATLLRHTIKTHALVKDLAEKGIPSFKPKFKSTIR